MDTERLATSKITKMEPQTAHTVLCDRASNFNEPQHSLAVLAFLSVSFLLRGKKPRRCFPSPKERKRVFASTRQYYGPRQTWNSRALFAST